MEANFAVKATDFNEDFVDGIRKVFSKDAILHITVNYQTESQSVPAQKKRGPKPKNSSEPGKKRGPKPKGENDMPAESSPKKRGRKPNVETE